MVAGEIACNELQAVEIAQRDGTLESEAERTQVGIPQHGRQVQRQRGLAELQAGIFTGAPAQQHLIHTEAVAALVVVVATIVVVVVAALGDARRSDELPRRGEYPGRAEAQAAARAVEIGATVGQA